MIKRLKSILLPFINSLKLYIINENTDEGVRADIFMRVNEGGEKLKPAFGWFVLVMGISVIVKEMFL